METLPVEERIIGLLRHLGIARAHVAAYLPGDWGGLLERHPAAVASLTLVCPRGMKTEVLRPHAGRLLIVSGDGGNVVADLMRAVDGLPGAHPHDAARLLQPHVGGRHGGPHG